jgi:hypothetical protein
MVTIGTHVVSTIVSTVLVSDYPKMFVAFSVTLTIAEVLQKRFDKDTSNKDEFMSN